MTLTPRPGILEVTPYVGGEASISGRNRAIRLASNENPLGASPRAAAAYAACQENQCGVLRPGLRADLALLPADPAACSPDELRALPVKHVWLAGQPVTPG